MTIAGCGGGGGGGSAAGTTSTIAGNIKSGQTLAMLSPAKVGHQSLWAWISGALMPRAYASAAAGGSITVTVEGEPGSSTVGSSGFFSLSGDGLGGQHTVTFKGPSGTMASMSLTVVPGSTVTLNNVTFTGSGATETATAEDEEADLKGTLSNVSCTSGSTTAGTITVSMSAGTQVVSFDAASTRIVNGNDGSRITTCADLATLVNSTVEVEAIVNSDGSLSAKQIVVNPGASEGESGDNEFEGTVASANCPTEVMVTRTDGTDIVVNISSSTTIKFEDSSGQAAASCTDLSSGTLVSVDGTPQSDGSFNATEIQIQSDGFEASGTINSTSCSSTPQTLSFTYTPEGSGTPATVTVDVTLSTVITVNDSSATCADLTNASADIEGVVQSDGSVAASRIEQGD